MKAEIFFDVCCLFFDVCVVVHSFSLWLPLSLGVNMPLLFVIVSFDIYIYIVFLKSTCRDPRRCRIVSGLHGPIHSIYTCLRVV